MRRIRAIRTITTGKKTTLLAVAKKWLAFFLVHLAINAHSQHISLEKVGLEDGLSQVSVLSIHQDHLNRMWFGTRNGVNCWDGIHMKQFYTERGDSTTVQLYNINEIIQEGNYLWLNSNTGKLIRLDLETLTFKSINSTINVTDIELYNDSLLCATRDGVWSFNYETEELYHNRNILDTENRCSVVYQDKSKVLWIIDEVNNQIIKIHNNKKEIIKIPIPDKVEIFDLLVDSNKRLWIATRYNGLLIYNDATKAFNTINKTSSPFYLKNLTVRDLVEDKMNRIWVGTFKGITIFDLNDNSTSFIEASENNEYSLSHNSVHCLYLSNDDNIWIGTYFGGINFGKISNPIFTRYSESAINEKPSYPVIGSILEDDNGNMWIGTEGGGLEFFDRENNTFTNFKQSQGSSGPSQTNIKSLCLTNNKQLLIGTFQGGINILDIEKREFKHFNNRIKHVYSIIPYKDNYLLGTDFGVQLFNLDEESFTSFLPVEDYGERAQVHLVTELFKDSRGIIWIGTEYNGIISFNPETKELRNYIYSENDSNSISSNSINCIVEDHLFRLWIGTNNGGLCLYNSKEDNFSTFNKLQNNLPSDFIYGISESRYGNLWIATSKGLSRFDVENELFFNYESESGFPLKELNPKALYQTREGEIFVGGIDGLISFKEEELLLAKTIFNIVFSKLEVNNTEIVPNDKSNILISDISNTKSFILEPNHTVFKITYSACNYSPVLKNKFQYKLAGFDNNWVNAEYSSSANYTNLNPGKYTFKVRGTDVVYKPITDEKSIEIIIKPPFSRTWYAYSLYFLILLSVILLFNYFYLGKVRLAYQLKNEQIERDRIKELNLYKLRFFTNISHEFMTPLTIILSSVEHIYAKNKIPNDFKNPLLRIFRNAKRLKNLNRELLDFRKIEQGHLKIKVQENDIVPYVEEICDSFAEIAKDKGVKYTLEKNIEHLTVWYDPIQMDKVFFNLLSNAFNHTSTKDGVVTVKIENKIDQLILSFFNNGKGISQDDVERVFDRFFQLETPKDYKKYYGSGIGLALSQSVIKAHKGEIYCESEIHAGTTFIVVLQKGFHHIDSELISNEKTESHFSIDKDQIEGSEHSTIENKIESIELSTEEAPVLLIVDDNSEIRANIKNLFVDKYHIEMSGDGNEGFEKALKLQPDIIISDVKMPNMSGFEMCEKLKRNINTSHIPVALLTAFDSEEDQVSGFKSGADSYITKPFSSEMLIASIESLFNNRRILQKKFASDLSTPTQSMARNKTDQAFMERVQDTIENHIVDSNFSMSNFAEEMGMSRTLFFKKIKTISGQTPNDIIQTLRLKKAADILLSDPAKNVSEIAYEVGFSSPRYFSQCFKQHFGTNPSKYGKKE